MSVWRNDCNKSQLHWHSLHLFHLSETNENLYSCDWCKCQPIRIWFIPHRLFTHKWRTTTCWQVQASLMYETSHCVFSNLVVKQIYILRVVDSLIRYLLVTMQIFVVAKLRLPWMHIHVFFIRKWSIRKLGL